MSHQGKLKSITKCAETLSAIGRGLEESSISELKRVIDDTFCQTETLIENVISTLEFLLRSKQETSRIRSDTLRKSDRQEKLSKTSLQDSISREKDLKPFWSKFCLEESKRLWLPIRTDLQDLDSTLLNGFSENIMSSLQCCQKPIKLNKKSLQKMSSRLSQSSALNITEDVHIRSRRIRIYPKQKQLELLKKCLGATRYFWNKTVDYSKGDGNKNYSFLSLRKSIMTINKNLKKEELWQKEIPDTVKELAIKSFSSAIAGCFSKGSKFCMSYKSKKEPFQTFYANSRSIKANGDELCIFKNRLKEQSKLKIKKRKDKEFLFKLVNEKKLKDFTVSRNSGKWYLNVPWVAPKKETTQRKNSVSLDPGVVNFQTFWSPENMCGMLGQGFSKKTLEPLFKKMDLMQSLGKNKRLAKLRTKVSELVRQLHHKVSNFLCKNFSYIICPPFNTKDMASRKKSLSSSTRRAMMALSHYKFKQILIHKANLYGTKVIEESEEYTSKTCGKCGHLAGKKDMSNRTLKCTKCKSEIDRDYNGARNIFIKFLVSRS